MASEAITLSALMSGACKASQWRDDC